MGRKKISTTVYLDPWHNDALKTVSARTRTPMAVLIRQALDDFLEQELDSTAIAALKKGAEREAIGAEMDALKQRLAQLENKVEEQTRLVNVFGDEKDGNDNE